MNDRELLGEILVKNHVPRQYIDLALKEQKVSKKLIGEILLEMSLVSAELIAKAIAQQNNLKYFSIFKHDIQEGIDCDRDFLEGHQIVPIEIENGGIKVGMVNPLDTDIRDSVSRYFKREMGKHVVPVVVSRDTFQRYIEMRTRISEEQITGALLSDTGNSNSNAENALRLLLKKAIYEKSSDIHIEPTSTGGRIRMRINGMLEITAAIDRQQMIRLTNIVKIASNINVVEKAMPQDGRIDGSYLNDPKYEAVDFRVSTVPNRDREGSSESIVIRVLDKRTSILPLADLGMAF
ncbi:MAG: Flp pilus assembly complex ATPase component TadA, partial [Nitrospirae bacterium]|nr:Flp pilus assembly complex ATPase component TadA [Nitrospirota bacterium]